MAIYPHSQATESLYWNQGIVFANGDEVYFDDHHWICIDAGNCDNTKPVWSATPTVWVQLMFRNGPVTEEIEALITGDTMVEEYEFSKYHNYQQYETTCFDGDLYKCNPDDGIFERCSHAPLSMNGYYQNTWIDQGADCTPIDNNDGLYCQAFWQRDFVYRSGDRVCDGNQVFDCRSGQTAGCASIRPSKDATDASWILQPNPPIEPAPSTIRMCSSWEYWSNDLQERDIVCITDANDVTTAFTCFGFDAECNSIDPTKDNWNLAWETLDIVPAWPTPLVDCDLSEWTANSGYKIGDLVCDSDGDVWQCKDTQFWELCNNANYDPLSNSGPTVWEARGDITAQTTPVPCVFWDNDNVTWNSFFSSYNFLYHDFLCKSDGTVYQCAPGSGNTNLNQCQESPLVNSNGQWTTYADPAYHVDAFASPEVTCRDYATTIAASKTFGLGDMVFHDDRVWKSSGSSVTSSPTFTNSDYTLTRYGGIIDANPPSVRCFNYIEGFKYMAGDFVCDDSLVWTPATDENNLIVEASWIRPSEMRTGSLRWVPVNGKLAVDPAPTSNTLTACFDWRYSTQASTGCADVTGVIDPCFTMSNVPVEVDSFINLYTFHLGEYACEAGRVFKCIDENCYDSRPIDDNGDNWEIMRFTPKPTEPTIDAVVECFEIVAGFNYLFGDRVCPNRMSCKQCNDWGQGNPLDCEITTDTFTGDSWSDCDIPINSLQKVIEATREPEVECYDWDTVTDPYFPDAGFTQQFVFQINDYAYNENRVWICLKPDSCYQTEPSNSNPADHVWRLTRYNPIFVSPQVYINVDYYEWQAGYNYLSSDYVKQGDIIWQCPPVDYTLAVLLCAVYPPNDSNPSNPWVRQDYHVIGTLQTLPTVSSVTAYNYLDFPDDPTIDNLAHYKNRVWKCLADKDNTGSFQQEHWCECGTSLPGDDVSCWELTRDDYTLEAIPQTVFSVDNPFTGCQYEYLMQDGVWDSRFYTNAALSIEVQSLSGQYGIVCSTATKGFDLLKQVTPLYDEDYNCPAVDLVDIANNEPNVARIMQIFDEGMFNENFPLSEYEYKDFLNAASCFPHFCSETSATRQGQISSLTPYSICKKELATFFAHRIYDSGAGTNGLNSYNDVELYGITDLSRQGLMFIEDENCISGIRGESCRAYALNDPVGFSGAFPRPDQTKYYYTRGLGKLHGNKDYGMFSEFMFGDKSILLNDPDRVVNEPWLAFASSIWRWMTPVSPTPSNHELVTGQWTPNSVETSAGLKQGLGVTIVASFGSLCGPGQENGSAFDIYQYYKKFLTLFDLVEFATDTNVCENMTKTFPSTGSAVRTLYWNWSGSECVLQSTVKTPWLLTIPGDFKRCWADNANGWAYLPKFDCYNPGAALYFPGDCIGEGNDYVIIPTLDDSQVSALTGYLDSFDGNDWWETEGTRYDATGIYDMVYIDKETTAVNGYLYTDAVADSTAGTFTWAVGDVICAIDDTTGQTFAFECRYPSECQQLHPLSNAQTYYWKLLVDNSCTTISIPVANDISCWNYWVDYNYMPDTIVKTVNGVFQCPGTADIELAVQCAFVEPALELGEDLKYAIVSPWKQLTGNTVCTAPDSHVDQSATHITTTVSDWTECHDYREAFSTGDFTMRWNRVFECKIGILTDNSDCTFTEPGSDESIWELTKRVAVDEGCEHAVFEYGDYLLNTLVQIGCDSDCSSGNWMNANNMFIDGDQYQNNAEPDETDEAHRIVASLASGLNDIFDDWHDDTDNVKIVRTVFSEENYNELFPDSQSVYSYDSLLKAISRQTWFCGEIGTVGEVVDLTTKQVCQKELAALLAFFIYETNRNDADNKVVDTTLFEQGAYRVQDPYCMFQGGGYELEQCNFYEWGITNEIFPIDNLDQYFERGAFPIKGNSEYGRLGRKIYWESIVSIQEAFLDQPEIISLEENIWMTMIDWYMTYQNYKPSCHDVIAGFWEPSPEEEEQGITLGFSSCLNIRDSNWCGYKYESGEASQIGEFYTQLLEFFGLEVPDTESVSCEDQLDFPLSNRKFYFTADPFSVNTCYIVDYETPFNRYTINDYARCVDYYMDAGFWDDLTRNHEGINNENGPNVPYHQDKKDS